MTRRHRSARISLTVTLVHSTRAAVLVRVEGKAEAWLPRSRVQIEPNKNGTFTVRMKSKLASDKGMI